MFNRQNRCSWEVADLGLFVPARRRRRRAAPHHRKKVVISLAQKPERRISGASPTYLRKPAPALEKTTARRRQAPRTQSPQNAIICVAMTTARGNFYRSVAAAHNSGERERGSRRTEGRTRRRHSHHHAAVDHTYPTPIYNPHARIRDSPTLPPPERTEKGEGIRGGAGETGGRRVRPCCRLLGEEREKGERRAQLQ